MRPHTFSWHGYLLPHPPSHPVFCQGQCPSYRKVTLTSESACNNKVESLHGKARTGPRTSSQSQARYQGPESGSTVQSEGSAADAAEAGEKAGGCVVGQYKEPLSG